MIASDGGIGATASTSSGTCSSARNVVVSHDPYEEAATMETTTTRTWVPNDDTPPPPPFLQVSRESAAPAPACSSNHELIALKEERRLEKNRVKAKNARKRKKCMIADLERNVKVVTQENEFLRVENSDLRRRLMEAELREGNAAADAADATGRQAHQNHAASMALAAAASGRGSMTPLSTGAGLGTGAVPGMDDLLKRHMDRQQLDLDRRVSLGRLHGRAADLLRDHPTGDALASQLNSWAPPESLSALPAFRDAANSLAGEESPMHSSSRMRGAPVGPGGLALSSLGSLGQPPRLTSSAGINIGAANPARLPLLAGGDASASALSFLENQNRHHHHLLRGVAAAHAARGGGDDRAIFARRRGGTS